jgi:hypothetical protein
VYERTFKLFVDANSFVCYGARFLHSPETVAFRILEGTNETSGVLIALCQVYRWRAPLEIAQSILEGKNGRTQEQEERLAVIKSMLLKIPQRGHPVRSFLAGKPPSAEPLKFKIRINR